MNDLETVNRALSTRTWRSEPWGANDRQVEIWFNNNWVPAFFSDVQAGDFFLDLAFNLESGRCFRAAGSVFSTSPSSNPNPTLMLRNSAEIVQAPSRVEIEINQVEHDCISGYITMKE